MLIKPKSKLTSGLDGILPLTMYLWNFYKKNESLHCTYLVCATTRLPSEEIQDASATQKTDDDDELMQDAPVEPRDVEQIDCTKILLVPQEGLEGL
jgi:hypothetical protein